MNSKEAEQAVLGAVLSDYKKIMPKVINGLDEEDFEIPENRNIFRICKQLFKENKSIDAVSLLSIYGESKEVKRYIVRLVEILPSISGIDTYIDLVKESSKRRVAKELVQQLSEQLSGISTLQECSETLQNIESVVNKQTSDVQLDPEAGFYEVYMGMDKEPSYMKTGFGLLDKYAKISKGDYVIIGARPSTGKTALTLQMMMNMSKEYRVVYFSLETSAIKLYQRMISCFTGTPLEQFQRQNTSEEMSRVSKYYDMFKKLNFVVVEAAGWTVERIRAKAIEERADIVFIDYLSLLKSRGNGRYEQITNISIDLHTMAQNTKIAVVALSQLSRNGSGSEPTLTDLRESGQIEQDADIVLLLSIVSEGNEPVPNQDRRLQVAKNKEGKIGYFDLAFNGTIQRFSVIDSEKQY